MEEIRYIILRCACFVVWNLCCNISGSQMQLRTARRLISFSEHSTTGSGWVTGQKFWPSFISGMNRCDRFSNDCCGSCNTRTILLRWCCGMKSGCSVWDPSMEYNHSQSWHPTAVYWRWHAMHILSAEPRSIQPSTLCGNGKMVSAFRPSANNKWRWWMWMVAACVIWLFNRVDLT